MALTKEKLIEIFESGALDDIIKAVVEAVLEEQDVQD